MTVPMDDVGGHPTEGPHHGELIELGNEDYHGEMVHEEETVFVYILDGAASAAVPIEAGELLLNVVYEGKPAQFKLKAEPDAGDPEGRSSRFQVTDAELVEQLDAEGTTAKLVVTIDGTSYRGEVTHDHDGHDH